MTCYFCENPRETYMKYFCNDCAILKRTISLYGKRVHEVVQEVLIRKPEQQKHKIKKELHSEEATLKAYNLRSKPILNAIQ